MRSTDLLTRMFGAFDAPPFVLPPPVFDWRAALFARGPRRRRAWTPARRHAETAACARRRRQIAAGRLTAANGLAA